MKIQFLLFNRNFAIVYNICYRIFILVLNNHPRPFFQLIMLFGKCDEEFVYGVYLTKTLTRQEEDAALQIN